jgi:phosphoribosyl 1,2-cyclic phosphodiesterase
MLRFKNLGSGSADNATVVEAFSGHLVKRLLIDCGLGIKALDGRLAKAGLEMSQIDAIFVTHEHADHIGCARQLALRHRTPVWMSHGTYAAVSEGAGLFATQLADFDGLLRRAQDGLTIDLGELQVMPFTVPHDAREPLQLRCSDGARHLGVLTDLGHATHHVLEQLSGCHALLLECNHDADMLQASTYPAFLKNRVGGRFGHLSNPDSAAIAKTLDHPGLEHIVAAHLSRQNNHPDLARVALADALGRLPADIGVADQASGCDWITV